jgi:hypothetical protein
VDDSRSVVRFDAELSAARRSQRNLMVAAVGVNVVAFVVLAVPALVVMDVPNGTGIFAFLGVVAAVQTGISYGIWRAVRNAYRRTVSRVQLRLEQLLDELEQGGMQAPPSMLGQVANALLGPPGRPRG